MRRDAEPHGGEILGLHAVAEHAVVVGVGVELVAERRQRPAAEARFDALHLHVGALHDADRHRRPALLHPPAGPLGDPPLRCERVGNVRLQRDAGLQLLQARADRASA